MLYRLLYDLLRILIVRGRGDAQLRAEVLALRHQLGVLERQVGRPRFSIVSSTPPGLPAPGAPGPAGGLQ